MSGKRTVPGSNSKSVMYRFRTKDERPKDADDIEFEDILQRKMAFDAMMFVRNGILAALKKKIDMDRREEEVATGKLEAAKRKWECVLSRCCIQFCFFQFHDSVFHSQKAPYATGISPWQWKPSHE